EALAEYRPYRAAEAVRYLTVALSMRPRAPAVHLLLGTALARAGSADEAIAAYRQAIALKPDFALAHFNLAGRLGYRRPAEAVAAYEEAIRLVPGYVEAHTNRGNVLQRLGRTAEALEAYRRALRLRPTHVNALLNLGTTVAEQGALDHALAY